MSVGLVMPPHPDSPPDLSSSRSSNTTADDTNDISHFEDIALDSVPAVGRDKPRLGSRSSSLNTTTTSAPSPPHPPRRINSAAEISRPAPLPLGKSTAARKPLHSSRSSPRLDTRPSQRFDTRQQRLDRGLGDPPAFARLSSSPGLHLSPRSSPRPSPRSSPSSRSFASAAAAATAVEDQNDGISLPLRPPRRPGLGTPRKSVAELERECDDTDSDEELPDEAIVANIPISPRPPGSISSARGSPERPTSSSSYAFGQSRTKSWDAVLGELSADVQALTVKLEDHHEETRKRSFTVSGSSPEPARRPKMSEQHRNKMLSLPPVQKGDPLIDPLPASKEKEKHLTRTRPSWLPPKDPKEEKKHLKEYQKMMSQFSESEKRKSAEAVENNQVAAREHYDAVSAWQRRVLQNWDEAMADPRTRDMWWRGVPAALRGAIWSRAVRNDLHLSAASYQAALKRAKSTERRLFPPSRMASRRSSFLTTTSSDSCTIPEETLPEDDLDDDRADESFRRSTNSLDADIETAFPLARLFQKTQQHHTSLRNMLLAYASYRSDTGHVRGTVHLAAVILLHLPQPEDAFVVFANLLNRPHGLAFCINDAAGKERVYRQILRAVGYKLPRLHAHLEQTHGEQLLDVTARLLEPLCRSLGCCLLDLEGASRVVDLLVFEGDAAIVRTVVAVLGRVESSLYAGLKDAVALLGWPAIAAGCRLPFSSAEELVQWIKWSGKRE